MQRICVLQRAMISAVRVGELGAALLVYARWSIFKLYLGMYSGG
jgi:hypothetical protein